MNQRFVVEELDPRTLTANPANFRRHPDSQRRALRASLEEHGSVAGPIWNRRTGNLIDGHARVEMALEDGEERILVNVVEMPLSQEKRLLRSFDQITSMALVDDEALDALIAEIDDAALEQLLGEVSRELPSFKEFDEESFEGVEDEWTEVKFRVPLGIVPIIEQQVERICEVCGIKEKAKGLALERMVQIIATVTDDELTG